MQSDVKVAVVRFGDRKSLMLRFVDPITGKVQHRSAGTHLKKEAERRAADWERELKEGSYIKGNISWADFRERYQDEVLPSLATSTEKKVRGVFNTIERHLSPVRLQDITAERLSYVQSKLRDEGRSENTIKGHMAHLLSALNWAVSMKMLPRVPTVKMPRRAKSSNLARGRALVAEEFDRLIAMTAAGLVSDPPADKKAKTRITAKGLEAYRQRQREAAAECAPSWQHLLRGLWLSGLRIGEALELCWDRDDRLCVDLQPGEHPMLRIPAALEKGNQDRLLPMSPEFAEFLLETPEAERTGYVFNPKPLRGGSDRLGPGQVIRMIGQIGKRAGIKVQTDATTGKVKFCSAHDLRRSFGARWASRVMPQVLMQLMRHESIDTTLKYYATKNAQTTADVLWQAHKSAKSNSSGNNAPESATEQQSREVANRYPR